MVIVKNLWMVVVIVVGLCRLNESEAITVDGDDEAKSCLPRAAGTHTLRAPLNLIGRALNARLPAVMERNTYHSKGTYLTPFVSPYSLPGTA